MQTPYLVLESEKLKNNHKALDLLCKKYFPSHKVCFSVKTNSLPQVLNILNKESCAFEVASQKELSLVQSFSSFKIFNGPCKTDEEIIEAKKQDCLINADSLGEIDKIASLGIKEMGIRVSFEESKFGIESKKINEAIDHARKLGLDIICLSSHPGTQEALKDYEQYLKKIKLLLDKLNLDFKYLDLGGGLPDRFYLENKLLDLESYFRLIKKHLSKFLVSSTIILEPGRSLVADTMYMMTKVHYIKENFGKKYAILDAGINFLPVQTLSPYRFMKMDKKGKETSETYELCGPLLFSNDIHCKFRGQLKPGDLIKVTNVGAYCYNLSWEISYDKPKVEVK